MKYHTDFAAWITAIGMNGKQVTAAGRLMGIGSRTALESFRGNRSLTETERLAMSAVRAGLPPWTPEDDEQFGKLKMLTEAMK